jgi:serine/threonine protein kinase
MLKGMLEGLRHVQETAGMTHLDVKAPNFFVDANGVTKLGDFGTALAGTAHQLDKNPIDNRTWQAPEPIKGTERRAEVISAFNKMNRAAAAAAKAEIDRTLSEDDQNVAMKNIKDAYDAREQQQIAAHAPKIGVAAKADTWAVGIDAYKLFTNESPFEASFVSEMSDKIKAFGDDPNNRVRLPDGVPPGTDHRSRSHLNTLLGQLLHPRPGAAAHVEPDPAEPRVPDPGRREPRGAGHHQAGHLSRPA